MTPPAASSAVLGAEELGLKKLGFRERVFLASRVLPLHAMVTSAGYARETRASYDWHGIKRGSAEFVLLQHTLRGSGRLDFEGKSFDVEPGMSMLLYFPHDNRYYLPPGNEWEFFYLCLNGAEIMRLWQELVARAGPLVRLDRVSSALRQAAHLCAEILRENVTSPFAASALAYGLTQSLLEELVAPARSSTRPAFVSAVEDYCRAELDKPIGVEDMSRVAGMSRYHFSRRFTELVGMSPAHYLAELRLNRAAELMRQGSLSVTVVAERTGFSDANYFCKVFRKRFGVSPGSFKKSGMY